jgi:23S rRNA (uracil1939-C5)-methyltransferase
MTMKNNNQDWQQGALVEMTIADLSDRGEGVGRVGERVVFVPDTVPGDRVTVRLVRVKPNYAHGKLQHLIEASPYRCRPSCIVADKCGGCQWQHIDYGYQRLAKQNLVIQALQRIGGLTDPPVDPLLTQAIDGSPLASLGYRNKASYPLSISAQGQVQAGYYQKNSHSLINLNRCPVQDDRLNPLLEEIKQDIQQQGWSVYDEKRHQGCLRHLCVRIGRRTGEALLTLVSKADELPGLKDQAAVWLNRYPQLVGVCLNINPQKTNVIFGQTTHCVAGKPYLKEKFARLEFQLKADTFFQVYTEAAETLVPLICEQLNLQGDELLLDAYCGIGAFTLPLALKVRLAIGLELQGAAVEQAQTNAQLNQVSQVKFYQGKVETLLPKLDIDPDIVILDPPRKGCDRTVLETLLNIQPEQIVYISCKPSTLARDLKILCAGGYQLSRVQPADFFPQTSHVESVAFLHR